MSPVQSRDQGTKLREHLKKFTLWKSLLNLQKQRKQQRLRSSRKIRAANRKFNRDYGLSVMTGYTDLEFERAFRMSREAFNELESSIAPKLTVNVIKGFNSSGSSISVRTRLCCTLRWLAGGN